MLSLSSARTRVGTRPKMCSHKVICGRPSMRIPSSAATYSASGVLCKTQVCRRLDAEMAHL
eukprot:1203977-Prorocentrum_lima.AAC.1